MIAAILRAQLQSMRFGGRRGAVFSAITGIIWYGIWTALAFAGAVIVATAEPTMLRQYLPLGFLGVCAYWQLIPILTASVGSGLDLRKLLIYPIPQGRLFLVEVLLRLTTGAEMVLVLLGGGAGLLRNTASGGWPQVPRVVCALSIFIVFNLLLSSGTRSLLERLLSRRKVREVLTFFLLLLYVVPRLMVQMGVGPKSLGPAGTILDVAGFPWTAAARAALPSTLSDSLWTALVSLLAWTLVAFWFARGQFRRNLRYDAIAAQATPMTPSRPAAQAWSERFYRLPELLLPDPLASIIEKELRSLVRTPRFRLAFVTGFTFGLMVWFPMVAGRHSHGQRSQYFLIIVCVYALTMIGQVTYWNCFGFDRSAAALYFAAPQPLSTVLLGKNIASVIFIYMEVLILIGVTAAFGLSAGWYKAVETLIVVGVCALYMLALGNISSVRYPRSLSSERVAHGGASSRFQGLIFLFYPLALLPVILAYGLRYAFESESIFVVMMVLAAAIGGVLYWLAMESAVETGGRRREQILQELSSGEGPVATE